jgi:SAM-dependent methyltransferase
MKSLLKRVLPPRLVDLLRPIYQPIRTQKFKYLGRPSVAGETSKARPRREREGFFEKYCQGKGLDIGFGGDLLTETCTGWDFEHGDAQSLTGIRDESFDFVYSSHTLEHLPDPAAALQNWWRVIKPGGYLLLYIPHRDLYEKKLELPSRWNSDHKHFFLPENDEPPDTLGLRPLIERSIDSYSLEYIKECREGWTITDPEIHSDGEYSIETVIRKKGR